MLTKAKRIMVPVDGSATSNKALAAALDLARDNSATVRLLHCIEVGAFVAGFDYSGQAMLVMRETGEKILEQALVAATSGGVDADVKLVDRLDQRLGDAVAEAARAWPADLIVLGTHGRHGVGRVLLGSGAEQIIRLAPVPVLVIRGDPGAQGAS